MENKTIIVMESHMGALYTVDSHSEIDMCEETCETCGDSDWYIGEFSNLEEMLSDEDIQYYDEDYVKEFFEREMRE